MYDQRCAAAYNDEETLADMKASLRMCAVRFYLCHHKLTPQAAYTWTRLRGYGRSFARAVVVIQVLDRTDVGTAEQATLNGEFG